MNIIQTLKRKFMRKRDLPDIAEDQSLLYRLLEGLILELRNRDVNEKSWLDNYCNAPKVTFRHDLEYMSCKLDIRDVNDEYWLYVTVEDTHWNTKSCGIAHDSELRIVKDKLFDETLPTTLCKIIHTWIEGEAEEIVSIPEGIIRLTPMLLDPNLRHHNNQKDSEESSVEFQLYKYGRIGKLVLPSTLEIPHSDNYSPFASYGQRPFAWNHHTKWKKIKIDEIENNSPYLTIEDGVLYSADKSRLIYCFKNKTSFIVPDSVTAIEPYAFCLQTTLKTIELHDGIIAIGDAAFMGCRSLEQIDIPVKIKRIANDMFDGCSSLYKVRLPEGLENIGRDAFRQCVSLMSIYIPNTVTSMCCFEGCSSLLEIEIPSGVEHVDGFMFCESLRKVTLHSGVKRICGYAFRSCDNLAEINFPDGVEYIGERAFYPSSLLRLDFPSTLKEIGSEAFYYNRKLRSVTFNSHPKAVGQAAFACCPKLHNFHLPNNERINDDVFIQDEGLDKFGFWD